MEHQHEGIYNALLYPKKEGTDNDGQPTTDGMGEFNPTTPPTEPAVGDEQQPNVGQQRQSASATTKSPTDSENSFDLMSAVGDERGQENGGEGDRNEAIDLADLDDVERTKSPTDSENSFTDNDGQPTDGMG